jgi:hypothetical protein
MIVKLRTKDNGWAFYDSNDVKCRVLTKEQFEFGCEINTPSRIEADITVPNFERDLKVVNIDNGKDIVYTTRAVYLLNNEGKTIDKLN